MAIWQRNGAYGVALILTLVMSIPSSAQSQWRPTQDVEFVIPFGLGGGSDLLARTLIKIIQQEKLVPVNIIAVNKPGGGASVGVSFVESTKHGDPHTLILFNPQTQITPLQVDDAMGWRSLTPIANLMLDDYLIMSRGDSPYNNAADLVADAKTKPPATITIGSAGTADDMAISVFESSTGIKLNKVRFDSGGEVLTALLGGHVDLGSGNPLEYIASIEAGKIKALGLYSPNRFKDLPDIPTLQEQGIEVVPFQMWRGVAMPKDAPRDAIEYWTDIISKVGESEIFQEYIKSNVASLNVLTGNEFTAFLGRQENLYRDLLGIARCQRPPSPHTPKLTPRTGTQSCKVLPWQLQQRSQTAN
jgi:putative tricarboxylic transport membrane protein